MWRLLFYLLQGTDKKGKRVKCSPYRMTDVGTSVLIE